MKDAPPPTDAKPHPDVEAPAVPAALPVKGAAEPSASTREYACSPHSTEMHCSGQ